MDKTVNMKGEKIYSKRAFHHYCKGSSYMVNRRRLWSIGLAVLIVVLFFSVLFITKTVTAQRNTSRIKRVASIEIKEGDTLWSIASDYVTDEYKDLHDYIDEIKNSNGMATDEIHTGNFIIVPYYVDAARWSPIIFYMYKDPYLLYWGLYAYTDNNSNIKKCKSWSKDIHILYYANTNRYFDRLYVIIKM